MSLAISAHSGNPLQTFFSDLLGNGYKVNPDVIDNQLSALGAKEKKIILAIKKHQGSKMMSL